MKMIDLQGSPMPSLGFGTWQLTDTDCVRATRTAIELGYRHIDTAQIYENEAEVGRALFESGIARKEFFVTTKLWVTNLTPARARESLKESLDKLQMSYVDLLLIHWPNPDISLKDTLAAMMEFKAEGKAKAIGVSNFPVARMREAIEQYKAPIACNQVEYHPLLSQRSVLTYARAHQMAVTAYSPLARGKLLTNPVIISIAKKHGKTPGQITLRWLIEQDGVAAIPKPASEKNARENFQIFDFELTDEDRTAINALGGKTRIINPAFAPQWDAA